MYNTRIYASQHLLCVQCNEERPECEQCLHGKRPCSYNVSSEPGGHANGMSAFSHGYGDPNLSELLEELPPTSQYAGVDLLELLDHFFHTTDYLWMGSRECQGLLQQHASTLAFGSSFLLHAILAFSAYHIVDLFPEQRRYGLAGSWFYSLTLQSYREAINEGVDADALFACCILLTMLSFKQHSNDLHSGNDLRVQSLAPDTVGIRFIGGPRILADAFARQSTLKDGIWKPLVHHCENRLLESNDVLADCPRAFRSMAGLEAICCGDKSGGPFDTALESIRLLMECYVSNKQEMVELTFCFAINLDPRFLHFVEESMPNAMLVMCYWYALVAQVKQWWAYSTAHIEGLKLLRWLQNTADISIQALLDFPSELLSVQSPTTQFSVNL